MRANMLTLIAATVLLVSAAFAADAAAADQPDACRGRTDVRPGTLTGCRGEPWQSIPKSLGSNKLEWILTRLEVTHAERGAAGALELARSSRLDIEGNCVKVTVNPTQGETTGVIDFERIRELGGVVATRSRHFLDVWMPFDNLSALSECDGVAFVQRLMKGVPLDTATSEPRPWRPIDRMLGSEVPQAPNRGRVVSEGVGLTGADVQHGLGYTGAGMKVAVIDLGFINMSNAIAAGELPNPGTYGHDFTGTGLETTHDHGTAVAEDVYDMAPGAELHLLKIGSSTDLENAKDYCVTNGIHIINHSVGWFGLPGDGTSSICSIAEDAYANGILWVNSAGNSALCHNEGTFTDANLDRYHEFAPHDSTLTFHLDFGETVGLFLTWYCWPATFEDYDLFLCNSAGTVVESSENLQNPGYPQEVIYYTATSSGDYHVKIYDYATTSAHSYDLFCIVGNRFHPNWGGEYYVKSGSILSPADAQHAVAVGAIHKNDWATGPIAYFSSQGPTNDRRIKPEIAGPDSCVGFTYWRWTGTSSSAPHVAGAAALVWSEIPELITADDVATWLTDNAIDMGDPGQDNVFGHGRLDLPPETPVEGAFYAVLTQGGDVLLRWTVGSLAGIEGLNIYRSASESGPFIVVNEDLIPPSSPGEYLDTTTWPQTTFFYELRALFPDGREDTVGASPASIRTGGRLEAKLYSAMPNPFAERTRIRFDVPDHVGSVRVAIYDVRGRLVRTLVEGRIDRGRCTAEWHGENRLGLPVASGVYFVRLEIGGESQEKKILVMR